MSVWCPWRVVSSARENIPICHRGDKKLVGLVGLGDIVGSIVIWNGGTGGEVRLRR